MKIKFIGMADMISKGLHFVHGGIYEVTPEVADYLENTFGCIEKIVEAKAEEKPAVAKVEEKPKVGTKVVPNK